MSSDRGIGVRLRDRRTPNTISRQQSLPDYPNPRIRNAPTPTLIAARQKREEQALDGKFKRNTDASWYPPAGQTLRQFYGNPGSRRARNFNSELRAGPVAGKGYGVFTRRNVQAGDILMSEQPIVSIAKFDEPHATQAVQAMLRPGDFQHDSFEELFQLSTSRQPDIEYELIRNNGWSLGGGTSRQTIWFGIAHINHSCRPSVRIITCESGWALVKALDDLPIGTEITVDYQELDDWGWSHPSTGMPSVEQVQASLQQTWGFACNCEACSNPQLTNKIRHRITMAERAMQITHNKWPSRAEHYDEMDIQLGQYIDDLVHEQYWFKCKAACDLARSYYEKLQTEPTGLNYQQAANLDKAREWYCKADEHLAGALGDL
ncbi:hypothetical protein F5Y18DRAFT_442616 [Xylariaceae sp. FL1019]|nr:hypothetical protein F5Y18DRAFT_442616 [Xylariaceae sp. FL1019]